MGEREDQKTEARAAGSAEGGTGGVTPWYAVRVKPNYEKPVAAALRGKGLEEFLPLFRSKRRWSDRVKVMDLPLFPGYVFCRLNLEARMPLITTPGFLYIVGVGKNPEPVDEAEIQAIQSVLRSGVAVTPWPSLVVGQKVQLKRGPLRGLVGVLTKIAANHLRMYVSVTLLKRSISVEVAPDWIQAVDEAAAVIGTDKAGTSAPTEGVPSGSKAEKPS
jgi:transcription antitermination factor NusG